MTTIELRPGLWRWTAPHPKWTPAKDRPDGWGREVGCLYYEPEGDQPTILVDPLAPPEGTDDARRFWESLDADVARRGRPVLVLLGVHHHERGAAEFLRRYGREPGATVMGHEAGRPHLAPDVARAFTGFRDRTELPGGVTALPIDGVELSETVFWIPRHRALFTSDALIGTSTLGGGPAGRVRVAPPSWGIETEAGARSYRETFRPSLRQLLDLPIELLIVSHGEPVTTGAAGALAEALESPAWGE